jgi:hypothetical protein
VLRALSCARSSDEYDEEQRENSLLKHMRRNVALGGPHEGPERGARDENKRIEKIKHVVRCMK